MHGQIDRAAEEGLFKLRGEQTLALFAELGQRHVQHAIAFCRKDSYLDLQAGHEALKLGLDPVGLPERELASARAYDQLPVQSLS